MSYSIITESMNYILLIAATFLLSTLSPVHASDGTSQYGQYGGGTPAAGILVDKMVSGSAPTKGGTQTYVDNFSASDTRFNANQRVYFQIKVKNTSNSTLTNVQMNDILPEYIDAVEGPGDYNPQTKTISWTYPELKSGEEKTERLIVQIKPQSQLPADRGVFCTNNKATGRSGNVYDDDTAQFCIEKLIEQTKGGVPKETPQAGAEFGLIFGALNIAGLGAGIYLRRKM